MDHSVYASSQWETMLQCNIVSHWLGAYTKWSLYMNLILAIMVVTVEGLLHVQGQDICILSWSWVSIYLVFIYKHSPGDCIKRASHQDRKSHCGDKTILWPCYIYGIFYEDKISLYWIVPWFCSHDHVQNLCMSECPVRPIESQPPTSQ